MDKQLILNTPVGPLTLTATHEAIVSIQFGNFIGSDSYTSGTEAASGANAKHGENAASERHDGSRPVPADIQAADTRQVMQEAQAVALLLRAGHQLEAYFAGDRRDFTFPLKPAGTPFQQAVWEALRAIPFGQTRTYKQIAAQVGCPAACRAVGMANNRNPIPIVIPCHRVVGSDGKLVGYAGGLDLKSKLLEIENRQG